MNTALAIYVIAQCVCNWVLVRRVEKLEDEARRRKALKQDVST